MRIRKTRQSNYSFQLLAVIVSGEARGGRGGRDGPPRRQSGGGAKME